MAPSSARVATLPFRTATLMVGPRKAGGAYERIATHGGKTTNLIKRPLLTFVGLCMLEVLVTLASILLVLDMAGVLRPWLVSMGYSDTHLHAHKPFPLESLPHAAPGLQASAPRAPTPSPHEPPAHPRYLSPRAPRSFPPPPSPLPSPFPSPLPPPPPPMYPPPRRPLSQFVAALNARFRDATASNDLSSAGVHIRGWDSLSDGLSGKPWMPCRPTASCGKYGDRFATSIIYPSHIETYGGGGFVLNPAVIELNCAYFSDGGTQGKACVPLGKTSTCIPGCNRWCQPDLGSRNWGCSWPPSQLKLMLEQQRALAPRGGMNEVGIRSLPGHTSTCS
jgi:hypothetical protein